MQIISKDNIIDTLEYMLRVAKKGKKGSLYAVGDTWIVGVDADFQKVSHDMGVERALKQKEEDKRRAKQDNI